MFETIINYIFMFFAFSAIGWTVESTYRSIGERRVINSGFLHGPICPIYGTGGLVFHVFLVPISQPVEKRWWMLLLLGMLLADTVEYVTSYLMEKLFHARWWDYSNNFLNIHGRICFRHTLYWAAFSFIYVYFIAPVYEFLNGFIPQNVRTAAVFVILAVFLFDLFLTVKDAINIQKLITKLDSLRSSVVSVSEAVKITAENRYNELQNTMSSNSEKFGEWKNDAVAQYTEIKQQLEKLISGERTDNSSKGTKRLLLNSGLYKSVSKRMNEVERIWEELKAKYKDDNN